MNSSSSRLQDRFSTTRWSVVMRHAATPSANAREALGELAQRYWYPVYVYMRRCGHVPAAAENLARRFLQQLLGQVAQDEAARGPYRNYLLLRLHAFLAADPLTIDVSDSGQAAPANLETRYQEDQLVLLSPEKSFQCAFALQILHRTLYRLRSEARQTGHADMYELLEPFLAREAAAGEYEFIATRLRSRPLTVVIALKRLRQRFRELAAEEMVDTVTSAEDLAHEQDALLAVLGDATP
jgi:RNA polymerase sigma-70 factor (ECF subfamily)